MTSMCRHWKMNLIFRQMEHDLNFIGRCKTASIFHANGRRPNLLRKMEDSQLTPSFT
jgi:hypothetical protein